MDLSKLSSNLPLSSAPTDESINKLNKELSDEFKIGARSIAALYRLSNSKNSLLIAKGYLDCINEISNYLENGNISSLSDLNNFLISKKSEFGNNNSDSLNIKNNNINIVDSNIIIKNNENNNENTENILDDSFKFSINNPTSHHFPKTNIPISIDHKNLKYFHNKSKFNNIINSNNNKLNSKLKTSNILSSSDEEVIADDDNDDSRLSSERGNSITNINNLNPRLQNNNNNNNNIDISFDDSNPNHKRKLLDNSISLKKTKKST